MRARPKNERALRPYVLLYCDGESENDYFKSLKQERYDRLPVNIKPALPEKEGYAKIIEEVDSLFRDKSSPIPTYVFIVLIWMQYTIRTGFKIIF